MTIIIKRNEDIQMKKHEDEMTKIKEKELRHNKNIITEKEKFDKKMNENKEKVMQKYITFYWNRKSRLDKKKKFFLHFNEKYGEKFNKLEEIEKAEEDKKKKLIKKLLKIETNQKEYLNKEKLKYENIKKQRLKYYNTCRNIKHDLERNLTEEANDILDYQNCVLSRQKDKEEQIKLKKENIQGKTIIYQMEFEKNLQTFYKKLYRIKSESIIKKNKEQKRKIYRDLKRAEYEAKKREEEERLLNQQVG